jgi:hypothetical protein
MRHLLAWRIPPSENMVHQFINKALQLPSSHLHTPQSVARLATAKSVKQQQAVLRPPRRLNHRSTGNTV